MGDDDDVHGHGGGGGGSSLEGSRDVEYDRQRILWAKARATSRELIKYKAGGAARSSAHRRPWTRRRAKDPCLRGACIARSFQAEHGALDSSSGQGPVLAWGVHRSLVPGRTQDADTAFDLHAEADALAYAASSGISVRGCDVYVTKPPCKPCMMLMAAAGIRRVCYCSSLEKTYGDKTNAQVRALAETHDVILSEDAPRPTVADLRADRVTCLQKPNGTTTIERALPYRDDIEKGEPDMSIFQRRSFVAHHSESADELLDLDDDAHDELTLFDDP
eukprot:CAMPEP_0119205744 /NCGR_PEP_ID=MMETSP1316-20130426/40041_1 /TAXON_ID=41880 /ORGANISM="Pycnococcus provasolii, Strain RCC2336" /LENGTH=275 /DNA_ID=CAMNT_0007202137 /DNA_START=195 /DNA_END=1024 /DNA_ORIENTATION=+